MQSLGCSATESMENTNKCFTTEALGDETLQTQILHDLGSERNEDVKNEHSHFITPGNTDIQAGSPDTQDSGVMLNRAQNDPSSKDETTVCLSEKISYAETCSSPVEEKCNVSNLNEFGDHVKSDKIINSSEQLGAIKDFSASGSPSSKNISHRIDLQNIESSETESEASLEANIDAKEGDSCLKYPLHDDVMTPVSGAKSRLDSPGLLNHSTSTLALNCQIQNGGYHINIFEDVSWNKYTLEKPNTRAIYKEHAGDADENLTNISDFSRMVMETNCSDTIDKRSNIELEYGMVDALEVARQVADAVQREVGDYTEPSCSSSEKISGGLNGRPGSPDSTSGRGSEVSAVSPEEVQTGETLSGGVLPVGDKHLNTSDNLESGPENCKNEGESHQMPEAAEEPEVMLEKGICFDLNREVCLEEMDHNVNFTSTNKSLVSSSNAAAVPGLSVDPFQFEGIPACKGSAATNAFQCRSPQEILDSDKNSSIGRTSGTLRCLDIDLNVVKDTDDEVSDFICKKQIPPCSPIPLWESAIELSSRRSVRINLDLNRVGDDDDPSPTDQKEGCLAYHSNGHRSPCPVYSSPSMRPCLKNIDLNDRPSVTNDFSEQSSYLSSSSQTFTAFGGCNSADPVISIMGTRVEVNRKDYSSQFTSFLPGVRVAETAISSNSSRTGVFLDMESSLPCSQPSIYKCDGLISVPSVPIFEPSSLLSYMVDPRGTSIISQSLGSTPAIPPPYSQVRFITLNGAAPPRPLFDLNSSFSIEEENRESGGSMQLSHPAQTRAVEEHLRFNSQSRPASEFGGKRKEPESGWESFQYNYKYRHLPWS